MAHFITLVLSLGAGVLCVVLMTFGGYYFPTWDLPLQFVILFLAALGLGLKYPGQYLPVLTGLCLPFVVGWIIALKVLLATAEQHGLTLDTSGLAYDFIPIIAAFAGMVIASRRGQAVS